MTQTFKEAFYFFRKNILKLLAYTFSVGILVIIIAQLLVPLFFGGMTAEEIGPETIRPFAQLMNLVIQPIYTGGLIALVFSLATDQGRGILNCLFEGVKRWPYMLLANVITTFLIFCGILLFVLPGIWLFSRLFLVPYLVMLKRQTPFEAITNSYNLTKGYSMTILVDIILLLIISFVLLLVLSFLQLLHPLFLLFFLLIFQCLVYVLYYRHYEILMDSQVKSLENNEV
ncbi:MAG: YciC family protein [Gammaproteobacteria bacterium]|nr:YciC family protein [Gammaproteobacteria bacterium]